MKKIQIVLLSFLFFLSQISYSQENYTWSEGYQVTDDKHQYRFYEDGFAYSVKIDGDEVVVQKFDPKIPKLVSENRKEKIIRKKGELLKIEQFQDKCYIFYYLKDKKEKTENLYIVEIDYKRLNISTDKVLISLKSPTYSFFIFLSGSFINFSDDKSKMLISYKFTYANDEDNHHRGIYVFDEKLDLILGSEIKMPYSMTKMDINQYFVDNSGVPYLYIWNEEKELRELVTIDIKTSIASVEALDKIESVSNNLKLHQNSKKELIFVGFSTKEKKNLFVYNVKTQKSTLYTIPDNIMAYYENKDDFHSISVEKVISKKDGSITVVAACRPPMTSEYVRSATSNTGSYRQTYFYYDYYIVKINPESKLEWMSLMPRKLEAAGSWENPYKYAYIEGKHYIIYIEGNKNIELALNEIPTTYQRVDNGYMCVYEVSDETGKTKRHVLAEVAKIDNRKFNAHKIIAIGNNSFVTELYKGSKKDKMLKLSY